MSVSLRKYRGVNSRGILFSAFDCSCRLAKARSPSIYTDPLAAGTEFFSEFVELSHKALAKLKFRVLNNILSVAFRVASCKPPKPAFVVLPVIGEVVF